MAGVRSVNVLRAEVARAATVWVRLPGARLEFIEIRRQILHVPQTLQPKPRVHHLERQCFLLGGGRRRARLRLCGELKSSQRHIHDSVLA